MVSSFVVEVGPGKPAANGKPAVGPEYRYVCGSFIV